MVKTDHLQLVDYDGLLISTIELYALTSFGDRDLMSRLQRYQKLKGKAACSGCFLACVKCYC